MELKLSSFTSRRLTILSAITLILLSIPLIAMQFTSEVDWQIGDFVVAGLLIFGVSLSIDMILTNVSASKKRNLIIAGIVILFLLIWAELGVGIFGTPFAGN